MPFCERIKRWFNKNKKYILMGGAIVFSVVGTTVGYVLYKNHKFSFEDWLNTASKADLEHAYKELQAIFHKTGDRPFGMQQISQELGKRDANDWCLKHPPNPDPNFRWTDANLWEKD